MHLSSDGGSSWQLLVPLEAYPNSFIQGGNQCGLPLNSPCFAGNALNWAQYHFDLSAFNGADVQIRFSFSTDGGLTLEGWYLDQINISHAQLADECNCNNQNLSIPLWGNGLDIRDLVQAGNDCEAS